MNQTELYDFPAYKRSRSAYRLECAFEYFVTLLITDAFLANLLREMGMKDSTVGIVSSFISLAFLFQLFSLFLARRTTNVKRTAIVFHTVSQLLFLYIYLVPFLPIANPYKQGLAIGCICIAYAGNYCVTSIIYKWGNSFVDPRRRADYSAGKEMLSLVTGMIVTLFVGAVMDHFDQTNRVESGFIFAAIAILIFSACDFICLMLIQNESKASILTKETRPPISEVLRNTLGNKNFQSVVVLQILWNVAVYFTIGFLGTYRIGELGFSLGVVQIINLVGTGGRFFLSKPFGKYSDKHSYAKGIELGLLLAAVAFGINIFTTPKSRLLIIGYTLFYHVSLAGVHQNMQNVTYSYVDSNYFVEASAIKNSIGGIFGFGASLLGSRLLSAIQANGNQLFGIQLYGQQLLSAFSFLLLLTALIYTRVVIRRQKVMIQ